MWRWLVAGLVLALLVPSLQEASGQERKIVVAFSGGSYGEVVKKAYVEPFERETGIKVITVYEGEARGARIQAQVQAGKVEWDVSAAQMSAILRLEQRGMLEPIDYSKFPKQILDTMPSEVKYKYGVGYIYFSQTLSYSAEKFPGDTGPKSWKDFWDVKKFPGPRSLRSGEDGFAPLEAALLADGVPAEKIYPLDVDRAFQSLEKIKPNIVKWWFRGDEAPQMLVDREVVMSDAWNGRVGAMQEKGAPLKIVWNQAITQLDYWVIPKGAPHREDALRFIVFASDAQRQAEFAKRMPYGPTNVAAYKFLDPEKAKEFPSYPDNLKRAVIRNNSWFGEMTPAGKTNQELLIDRWNTWILK